MNKIKKDLWFGAKVYGWGWTPITWQGWLVTGISAFFIAWDTAVFVKNDQPTADLIKGYSLRILIYVAVLLAICLWKGEKPRWRWGK